MWGAGVQLVVFFKIVHAAEEPCEITVGKIFILILTH